MVLTQIRRALLNAPVLHPENKLRYYWDLLILTATVYFTIEIPLSLVFELPESLVQRTVTVIVGVLYVADIVLSFSTAVDEQGRLITDRKEIARRYMKGWFAVDLLAAVPFGWFVSGGQMLRLNRLLKLVRMNRTIRTAVGRKANPALLRLGLLVFWVVTAAHLISCAWIAIRGNPDSLSPIELYIQAFYWTTTTLTTIGYGDITPQTTGQTLFVIFIEILGAGMYGLIIANIANLIANIDIAKTQYREKVERVNSFLRYRNIPEPLQKKIDGYYAYLWESRRGYDESAAISDLPAPLQVQVSLYLNQDIIEKVPLFEGAGQELLKDIVMNLNPVVFTPGDHIVTAGEVGHEMYFISKGSVDVVSADGETVYATLTDGQFFGEIALLLSMPRTASIVARDYCDLYRLNKETFDRILEKYPDFGQTIKNLAAQRRVENQAAVDKRKRKIQEDSERLESDHLVPDKVRGIRVERTAAAVLLTWLDAQHGGNYEIIRKQARETQWTPIADDLVETRYTDRSATAKRTTMYRIRAVNVAGPGPWSETYYADRRLFRRR